MGVTVVVGDERRFWQDSWVIDSLEQLKKDVL